MKEQRAVVTWRKRYTAPAHVSTLDELLEEYRALELAHVHEQIAQDTKAAKGRCEFVQKQLEELKAERRSLQNEIRELRKTLRDSSESV